MDKIDIVIPWVDGGDPNWRAKKAAFTSFSENDNESYNGPMRYRDYGTLKYLLRSIECNASWVNHIFIVTDNQRPNWLDDSNEKISVVDHKDFIDKKYLPTFNTNTIEMNIYKINQLSEHFVLLNDDMIFNDKVKKSDFFYKELPVDNMNLSVVPTQNDFSHILLNNMLIINKYFTKKDIFKTNWKKIFNLKNGLFIIRTLLSLPWTGINGFYNSHQGIAYTKKSFENMWKMEYEKINETCLHKTRSSEDISDWVVRYYQLCSGKFMPGSPYDAAYYTVDETNKLKNELLGKKHHKFICINDVDSESDFTNKTKNELNDFLQKRFPVNSKFEK